MSDGPEGSESNPVYTFVGVLPDALLRFTPSLPPLDSFTSGVLGVDLRGILVSV